MTHDPRTPEAEHFGQQLRTARWCGYSGTDAEAVLSLNRDHDPLHCILAGLFGKSSPTLRWVTAGYADDERTHPTRHDDAVGWEEDLCLEVARWLNTGEYGPTMRVLWWFGISETRLRWALCERLGRKVGA